MSNKENEINFDYDKFKNDVENVISKVLENIEETKSLKSQAYDKIKEENNIDNLSILERLQANIEISSKNLADIYLTVSKVYDNLSKTIKYDKIDKNNNNNSSSKPIDTQANKFKGLF
jgi:hypothetical protein